MSIGQKIIHAERKGSINEELANILLEMEQDREKRDKERDKEMHNFKEEMHNFKEEMHNFRHELKNEMHELKRFVLQNNFIMLGLGITIIIAILFK